MRLLAVADSMLESSDADDVDASEGECLPDGSSEGDRADNASVPLDAEVAAERSPSAGTRLREAREARGLSQADLARTLNLQLRTVEALECDDDARLPGPAFVRGYLRSYARLMGMDPEPLLVDHQTRTGGVVPEVHASPRLEREDAQPGVLRQRPRLIMVIAALLLALIGCTWLLLQRPELFDTMLSLHAEPSASDAAGRSVERAPAPAAIVEGARDGRSVAVARVRLDSARAMTPTDGGDDGERAAPVAAEIDVAAAPAGTVPEEVRRIATGGADAIAAGPQDAPAAGAAELQTGAAAVVVTTANAIEDDLSTEEDGGDIVRIRSVDGRNLRVLAGGDEHLRFTFEGECWVHVRDAEGQSVYQDLNRSGETVELWGQAPFRIRLGYAPAVTLIYNGSRVALRPFTRNDVANLTLGR
ncbi:MAG: RodZ domain-containing protein [Pseudomonadota bacterium]|nr:RodZ domain-containing protein [Pseudomonadota bacterium]